MAKRMRSLASVLWDADLEAKPCDIFGTREVEVSQSQPIRELEERNAKLLQQVSDLQREIQLLKIPKPLPTVLCGEQPSHSELLRAWPKQIWLGNLRADVVALPRLRHEILPQLHESNNCSGSILFDLCMSPKAPASAILSHAEKCIQQLSRKYPAVFKIGISSNPIQRWTHKLYGYVWDKRECWHGMKIVAVSGESFSAALIESALIRLFQNTPGCRNDRPGGETQSPDEGPHFTYVVYKILLPPLHPIRVVSR